MKLEDAIFLVIQMHEGATVFAKRPFFRGAEATIGDLTAECGVPEEVTQAGFAYFLEDSGIRELLEMISTKAASRATIAEFVIHYATFDAYPSWFSDLQTK